MVQPDLVDIGKCYVRVDSTIYFVVVGILGDNLGVNSLFGFYESFVAEYCCRFCQANKHETQTLCVEREELLRNEDNYKYDAENGTHGVRAEWVFNQLPLFHNLFNLTCDRMHDWHLGVCRYVMPKIINHCIENDYFTLDRLNDRLKFFDSSELDHGNKVSSINLNHVKSGL